MKFSFWVVCSWDIVNYISLWEYAVTAIKLYLENTKLLYV